MKSGEWEVDMNKFKDCAIEIEIGIGGLIGCMKNGNFDGRIDR